MNTKRHGMCHKILLIGSLLSAAALMTACGGGGGDNGVAGAGNASAVVQGPISGFGSVIVNGVRFDDSAAKVTIDDNDGQNSNDLKLGMMVEIESELGATATAAKASSITASSHIQGPISGINTTSGTVTVLGLTITLKASTIFDNAAGIADLHVNDFIEVYGLGNGPDGLTATRIEKKTAGEVRSVGTVQSLDTVAKTFKLRGITVNYLNATLDNLGAGLANDMLVRVKGSLVSGVIVATKVKAAKLKPAIKENEHAELEGLVSNFVSSANFEVLGVKVDASKLSPSVSLANGVRIEVEGTVTNGVLIATKVELKRDDVEAEIELHGTIGDFNAGAQTFTMRSGTVRIHFTGSTTFLAPLTLATLGNTVTVEVKGNVVNGIVEVTRIKIDN